jgi:hypothetical protein
MEGSWQASERGDAQLRELNSMIRRQEGVFGPTFAMFMAANAVLVFSFYQQEDHYLARSAISLVALAMDGALFLLVIEARAYLELWMGKALALESDLGVAQEFRVWGETPKSMLKSTIGPMTAAALLVYWAACLVFAALSFLL